MTQIDEILLLHIFFKVRRLGLGLHLWRCHSEPGGGAMPVRMFEPNLISDQFYHLISFSLMTWRRGSGVSVCVDNINIVWCCLMSHVYSAQSWPCLTFLPCVCGWGSHWSSGAVKSSAVWVVLCVSPSSSLFLPLLFPGCLDLSDLLLLLLLLLWTHVFMGPGTIRKAQNLLKQYSQHGLDGKKGGSNLTPLEGNTTPPLPPPLFGFSSSLTEQTCHLHTSLQHNSLYPKSAALG